MPKTTLILLFCINLIANVAHATTYQVVDRNGHITVTNIRPQTVIQNASQPSTPLPSTTSPTTSTRATFPTISPAVQASRDNDRRVILQDELNAESASLTKAANSKNTAQAATHQRNIDALQRELKTIK